MAELRETLDSVWSAPASPSAWSQGPREGLGTSLDGSSRIWFTLAQGVLREIYHPALDSPRTNALELLVTDGETFCHQEHREPQSTTEPLGHSLGYSVASYCPDSRYRLLKEILCAPGESCVLMRCKLETSRDWTGKLSLYAVLEPRVDALGGAENSAVQEVAGQRLLVARAGGAWLAFGASPGFETATCARAGAGGALTELAQRFPLEFAGNGALLLTGKPLPTPGGEFTLGVAFGPSQHAAITALLRCLNVPWQHARQRFTEQWARSPSLLPLDRYSTDGGRLQRLSYRVLRAHEDKSFPGAFLTSLGLGLDGGSNFGRQQTIKTRDLVQCATGLLAAGDREAPLRVLMFLAAAQRPDGGFPLALAPDGMPCADGLHHDSASLPLMLAWRLWKENALGDFDPWPLVKRAALYLVQRGPATQEDRWGGSAGYSPSTLAATIAALICAAELAESRGKFDAADFLRDYADFLETHLEAWTVTTKGNLIPEIHQHYIRLCPADMTSGQSDEDPNSGYISVGDEFSSVALCATNEAVDVGFLDLVRYGLRRPEDPIIVSSLQVTDTLLRVTAEAGPFWRRHTGDRQGATSHFGPLEGGAWPLLTAERGLYEVAAGRAPRAHLHALEQLASSAMLPERVWDGEDRPDLGLALGQPMGDAQVHLAAHAEYLKLLRSIADGRVFDQVPQVAERYQGGRGRKSLEIWQQTRQLTKLQRGRVLRVLAPYSFRLRWTLDDWAHDQDTNCTETGLGLSFVDLQLGRFQKGSLRFTFFWPDRGGWEGKDFSVEVL